MEKYLGEKNHRHTICTKAFSYPYSLNIMVDTIICITLGIVRDLELVEVKQRTCVAHKQISYHIAKGNKQVQTLSPRCPQTGSHRQLYTHPEEGVCLDTMKNMFILCILEMER